MEDELQESALWRAIILGSFVGAAAMFLVGTAIVLVGGVSLGPAAAIGAWVGFVIGPYVGGFAMFSSSNARAERRHQAALRAEAHDQELRTAA